MLSWLESLLQRADQPGTSRALWFSLLCLFTLLILWWPWNPNEENYFQLAYRTFSPDSFSDFHAAFDKSAARFFVEYPIGWLISIVGYDVAHTVARAVQVVIYTTGFTIFFKELKFSPIDALAVIAILVLSGQELYGGEWLFEGVEAKTFAYGMVVAALGFGMRGNWTAATVLLAFATWMHFLVGGFWMIALALLQILRNNKIWHSFRLVALYSLLVLPLVILMGVEQFGHALPQVSPSATEIYVQRNAHHIAPFFGVIFEWVIWGWAEGIAAAGLILLAFSIYRPYARDSELLKLVSLLLLYLLIALAVTFLDRNTFLFSKFYVFRPSSLILLLAVVVILSELRHSMLGRSALIRQLSLAILVLLFLLSETKSLAVHIYRSDDHGLANVVSVAERYSKPGEIVLTQPANGASYFDVFLPRQIHRPTLVSYKYVPVFPPYLIRWHQLIEARKQVFEGHCDALSEYPVRLLVVSDDAVLKSVRDCGDIVWQDKKNYLVKMSD